MYLGFQLGVRVRCRRILGVWEGKRHNIVQTWQTENVMIWLARSIVLRLVLCNYQSLRPKQRRLQRFLSSVVLWWSHLYLQSPCPKVLIFCERYESLAWESNLDYGLRFWLYPCEFQSSFTKSSEKWLDLLSDVSRRDLHTRILTSSVVDDRINDYFKESGLLPRSLPLCLKNPIKQFFATTLIASKKQS